MITFERINENALKGLAQYFVGQTTHVSDFSLGFQFMWSKYMQLEYAIVGDCLVLKEEFEGKTYFHYPISRRGCEEEELSAIETIETYCRDNDLRLHYTNVPKGRLSSLVLRYGASVQVENPRRWRDYLYRVADFQTYAGGKYSGQRNHVNKFKKNYPQWTFRAYRAEDERLVREFLVEYDFQQRAKNSDVANEELLETSAILSHLAELGLFGGLLFVADKLVAFAVGERCGDMVIVHIEKALRAYEGVYPFIAQRFALAFCGEGVDYLNRMDDAGDGGLRKSKLQYLPCELVDKFNVTPLRAIDKLEEEPTLQSERLTISPLTREVADSYARLAGDIERNRYWGFDYRTVYGDGKPSDEWFLKCVKEDFIEKNELSLGIYLEGQLVGEVVLHRFGYLQQAEVGARLLPEFEGRGYASEAIREIIKYGLIELNLERMEAKCYRENERSRRMLLSAGLRPCGEDETFYYFYKTAAM